VRDLTTKRSDEVYSSDFHSSPQGPQAALHTEGYPDEGLSTQIVPERFSPWLPRPSQTLGIHGLEWNLALPHPALPPRPGVFAGESPLTRYRPFHSGTSSAAVLAVMIFRMTIAHGRTRTGSACDFPSQSRSE